MIYRKCPKCQKSLPVDFDFCRYCGESLPPIRPTKIENLLDRVANRQSYNVQEILQELHRNWILIKQESILTWFLITQIYQIYQQRLNTTIAHRVNLDSRTGGIFEDHFAQLLGWYLASRPESYSPSNEFLFKLTINESIIVPGEKHRRKPDILLYSVNPSRPRFIIELKTRYSHRSLVKYYTEQQSAFSRISPGICYNIILFTASSLKTTTFKNTVPSCRIICQDFHPDADSQQKGIYPTIVDSMEAIFDEISIKLSS